jgi:uncharacterized protein YndB with AHSA1/START domain
MAMDRFGKLVNPHTVVFERLLPGPIERVFDFLWNEDKRRLWLTSGAMPTTPGAKFEMRWKHSEYSPNKSVPPERMKETDEKGHTGTFTLLAYEPPHRLAYTFGESRLPAGQASEVEFVLKPEGDQVRLILTHSKVPDRDYALNISGGWHSHLDVLEYQLRNETPPGFWDVWRPIEGVYEKRYSQA